MWIWRFWFSTRILLGFAVVVGGVGACASSSKPEGGSTSDSQPAALTVRSFTRADVLLDGEPVGTTPVSDLEVKAGAHELKIRREGFREVSHRLDLAPAEERAVDDTLVAEDPGDPEALGVLAGELGLSLAESEQLERYRGRKKAGAVTALYPRRDMRLKDLDQYRIDVTADFEPGGTLEFRLGKTVLHREPFEPTTFETISRIPDSVRSALKGGKTVTWGYYPDKGRPVTAKFTIVKRDLRLQKRLDWIEKRLRDQHPLVRAQMRAQVYLDKRLYYAAYREASFVAAESEWAPQAYAIMQAALRQMKLHKSALWVETSGPGRRGRFRRP
jgi:hypothetical protein